jgi:hypothetical protein
MIRDPLISDFGVRVSKVSSRSLLWALNPIYSTYECIRLLTVI